MYCRMLYEFHRKQNAKKPGSVHATYLLTGIKRSNELNGVHSQQNGEDTVMRSSPPLPSSSIPQPEQEEQEQIVTRSIMLVKEEHLDRARALFDTITSIHVYSLQANGLSDGHTLTECNRRVAADYAAEDPLTDWGQYGVIQNPRVKRRTATRIPPPPPAAAASAKPEAVKAKAAAAAANKTSAADLHISKTATHEPGKTATAKPAPLKKQESSLFKSFAKGAAKPKPAPAPAKEAEDADMTGFSDDEGDDGDSGLPEELTDIKAPSGKSKKDRQAELDAMMDVEDEPMDDAGTPAAAAEEEESQEAEDAGAIDKADSQVPEHKESVVVENGRRRGRRRVMKKKTVKDEDGYLGKALVRVPAKRCD